MAAERRFADSATRIARMAGDDSVDYGAEAVQQVTAKQAFTANVQVVKVADQCGRPCWTCRAAEPLAALGEGDPAAAAAAVTHTRIEA